MFKFKFGEEETIETKHLIDESLPVQLNTSYGYDNEENKHVFRVVLEIRRDEFYDSIDKMFSKQSLPFIIPPEDVFKLSFEAFLNALMRNFMSVWQDANNMASKNTGIKDVNISATPPSLLLERLYTIYDHEKDRIKYTMQFSAVSIYDVLSVVGFISFLEKTIAVDITPKEFINILAAGMAVFFYNLMISPEDLDDVYKITYATIMSTFLVGDDEV